MQFKALYFIALIVCFSQGEKFVQSTEDNDNNIYDQYTAIYNLTNAILNVMQFEDAEHNQRLNELKEKLNVINKYVTENKELNKILVNVTKQSHLNETNFYESLSGDDYFKFLTKSGEEPKNLYLKLKERINRDDVVQIISKRDKDNSFMESARKAMGPDLFERNEEQILNDLVDQMIAAIPNDDHDYKYTINDSIYWDPQKELLDLHDYHQHDGRRIYKGERTTIRYYPFMVSIHVLGRFWCGGVIYWHDIVLTSASCLQLMHNNRFFRENPKVLEVRIGSNHSKVGGELVEALEVYFHPGYSPKTLRNNIAIIRIRRHLKFNYHRIPKCIDISHNRDGIPDTAEVLLLGWGVTKMSQKLSFEPIFLQRKFLPIYPNKFCKEVYGDKFISRKMFCAGTMTTGEGACDHDAGGPAILAGRLVGIISFGPAVCGLPNAPTVFTLVGAYADWIETINETMPSYYRGKSRTTTSTRSPLLGLLDHWTSRRPRTRSPEHITPVPKREPTNLGLRNIKKLRHKEKSEKKEKSQKTEKVQKKDSQKKQEIRKRVDSDEGWSLDMED